jgi:predicted AAA+ superfamily ATPase
LTLTPYLYFYRDKDQKEVDLIIEQNSTLYPIEFKKTASPGRNASKHFPVLEKLGQPIGHGAVICLRETGMPLSQQVDAIPISYL